MKKITFLILSLITVFSFAQNGGNTCGTAVDVTSVGAGPVFNFTGTDIQNGTLGGETDSTIRDAAWFFYTATADGTINVNSCAGTLDTRLHISNGSCGSLVNLATSDDDCDAGLGSAITIPVISGVTYYIEWDSRWSSAAFNWSLEFTEAPQCSEVEAVFQDLLLGDQFDFSWDAATFGSPIGYNWEIVADGAGQGNSIVASGNTAGTNASSGSVLTLNTPYDLFIQTDCGGGVTSAWVGPINSTTLSFTPVVNDVCAGALPVSVQGDVATAGEAAFAAASLAETANTNLAALACAGFTGNALDDVWYSFVAGSTDVNITANVNFDAVLTLFSGDCNALIQEDCADATISGPTVEQISATGLTIGSTYYFRVYSYGTPIPANPTFEFALWTPQTLSSEDVLANTTFSYFPNPVKNTLSLKAQNNIENVTVFNMVGQAVIKTAPNTMESEIDMQSLNSGTYFAQVTINNVTKTIKVLKQ